MKPLVLRHSNKTLLASAGCTSHLLRWPASTIENIACFGRLADGRFAQPRADATVLLECLILLAIWSPVGMAQVSEPGMPTQLLATVVPPYESAEYRIQDLNQDGTDDLLVIGPQGQIHVWSGQATPEVTLKAIGGSWQLPHPQTTLLALSSFSVNKEATHLVTLTPQGLLMYRINANATIASEGQSINPRMKFQFRIGQPVFADFLQDINQDGKLDIVVPMLDSCEVWINQGGTDETSASDNIPRFTRVGKFPVRMSHHRQTALENTSDKLSENFSIPSLLLKDVNGDRILDLIVKDRPRYDYYLFNQDGVIPDKPTVSLNLDLFQDTTPKGPRFEFGETLNVCVNPYLAETDLNYDGIGDYLIFHGRKIWLFHGTRQGPQFTDPSTIIKIADDITAVVPFPLDDDDYPDLLMLKVQIPSCMTLIGGLFSDWKIKTESIGYQSKQGKTFELRSTWQGEIYLQLPAILSLISHPDILKEFEIKKQHGAAVQGDFNGDGNLDVAMLNLESGHIELWFGREGDRKPTPVPTNDQKEFAAQISQLLFSSSDNVWDIERIKTSINALMDKQVFAVTGGRAPDGNLAQFKDKIDLRTHAVDIDHDNKNELLFAYSDPNEANITRFDLYAITGK